jgi:hypothetical protein
MKRSNIKYSILVALLSIMILDTLDAQRRRTSSRTRSSERSSRRAAPPVKEITPWVNASLGTLGFGGGFSISGKGMYCFEYKNRVSAGLYGKAFYDLINNIGVPDESLFSYGGGAFTRLNVTTDIFLQGEYSYTSFEIGRNNGRDNIVYPSIGGGYKSGVGDWTYGFHLMLPLDNVVRDFVSVEYWIDFTKKF